MAGDEMQYDVVIVGAGPAGLSAALRLKQRSPGLRVCVLEKGSEVGAHILSGCVLETRALDELLPDWEERGAPLHTPAGDDRFLFLTKKHAIRLPTPPAMHNKGNYIVSLGDVCRWLATQAEALGVEVFPGFPAAELLLEDGRVAGVITGAFGIGKDGEHTANYQPGVTIRGTYTLFAEGCRGSLSQQLMAQFELRKDADPQTYGIGIKEMWEVQPEQHAQGRIVHSVGWPMDAQTYGGSFLYHLAGNKVAVGYVVGLDYQNPHLDPFMEFQRFKTHPAIAPIFKGARRIAYGARALNEGGFQSIPKLTFPGGALVGCAAGFMNVPKVKGTHTAMKSAMLAADALADALAGGGDEALASYDVRLRESWVYRELHQVRNIRPGFHFGLLAGLLHAAIDTFVFRGKAPWTLHHKPDHAQLKLAKDAAKISYPKPDGVLTFDRLSSVFLSSTNHEENQPAHLKLRNPAVPVAHNLARYDAPEQRYCPAGVYEIVQKESGPQLQINAQNCVHCKTCDIKDPTQNIVWTTPEGGGGPNYSGM
jgi:electron-transferring-flavoprotein dehydrogenase